MAFLAAPAVGAISAGAAAVGGASAGAAGAGWLSSLLVGSSATGGGGLIGSAGAVTLGGALGFGSSLLAAGTSILGGIQQGAAYKAQGAFGKLQAKQEELAGLQDTVRIKRALNEDLAMQAARWGVAGIDPSSNVVGTNADDARADASLQVGVNQSDSYFRQLARRISARNSGFASASSIFSGGVGAAGALADYGANVYERG